LDEAPNRVKVGAGGASRRGVDPHGWGALYGAARSERRGFPRQSPEGRRLCLDRKFHRNLDGRAGVIVTVTAEGSDLLPWDESACTVEGPHKHSGVLGCTVDPVCGAIYEATFQARASRLREAAEKHADRLLRAVYGIPRGRLPRRLASVRAPQRRGVSHVHYLDPVGTEVEKIWSRAVYRYMRRAWESELANHSADERWEALKREYLDPTDVTPGVYGLGFVDRSNNKRERVGYMARNAAGYLGRNVQGKRATHYVSVRITQETGVTMRVLRAVNYLWIRRRLIAMGELLDDPVPCHWKPEWAAEVLRVEALANGHRGPPPPAA